MNTFCPECGTKLQKDVQFCPECGFKIQNISPSQSPKTQPIKEEKIQEIKTEEIQPQVSKQKTTERRAKNNDTTISFHFPIKPIIFLIILIGIAFGGYYGYEKYGKQFLENMKNGTDVNKEKNQNEEKKENKKQEKTENQENTNSENENQENTNSENENQEDTMETFDFDAQEETIIQDTSSLPDSAKFRVIVDKAYFYDSADTPNSNSSYLIRGDYVEISPAKSGTTKYFVHFTNSTGIVTTGYIRKADLQAINEEYIENEKEQDEENKGFIRSHYRDIKYKNFRTAYENYLYPKAKSVNDFANWYTNTDNIEVGDIQKIGYNDYRFRVIVSSYDSISTYKTSMKVGKVDGVLKILGYTSKKIN